MTDFVDAVTAELMLDNVGRLVRRHLVLFVALSDPDLLAMAAAPPDGTRALHRAVVASELLARPRGRPAPAARASGRSSSTRARRTSRPTW